MPYWLVSIVQQIQAAKICNYTLQPITQLILLINLVFLQTYVSITENSCLH